MAVGSRIERWAAGEGGAGRHVGGALFVNVPAEMTGRWTLRPRPAGSWSESF